MCVYVRRRSDTLHFSHCVLVVMMMMYVTVCPDRIRLQKDAEKRAEAAKKNAASKLRVNKSTSTKMREHCVEFQYLFTLEAHPLVAGL